MYKSLWQIISIFVLIITNYIPDVGGCHHQKKEDAPRQFSPTGHRKGINYNLVLENIFVTLGVFTESYEYKFTSILPGLTAGGILGLRRVWGRLRLRLLAEWPEWLLLT